MPLQNTTASYPQTNPSLPDLWDPVKTIDRVVAGGFTSWAIFRAEGIQAETIVWETQSDLDLTAATPILFSLLQQETITAGEHNLGRFRLSYTTDSRADNADGLVSGGDGATFTTLDDSSILVSGSNCCHPVYSKKQGLTPGSPTAAQRPQFVRPNSSLSRDNWKKGGLPKWSGPSAWLGPVDIAAICPAIRPETRGSGSRYPHV